jgi:hypothetical protein
VQAAGIIGAGNAAGSYKVEHGLTNGTKIKMELIIDKTRKVESIISTLDIA